MKEKTLADFQAEIKAPKSQFNSFGKYNYRNCEDILEAVKPVITPSGFWVNLSDEIVEVGSRIYVKATAILTNGTITYSASAFARESNEKKGMDESQITGAASSYARKYALNGLFAIDDTKDADSGTKEEPKKDKPEYESDYVQFIQIMLDSKLITNEEFTVRTPKANWNKSMFDAAMLKARTLKAERDGATK
jgi:hypothetical protein